MDEEGEEYNSTSDCDSDISVSDSENDRHEDDDGRPSNPHHMQIWRF